MKKNYGRLKIAVLIIVILGLYILLVQTALAGTRPPNKAIQITQIEVTGKVTDANGAPLPGATISVKGENRGTTTNLKGYYNITAGAEDILVFSYIGFKTIEVQVNGRSEVNIQLEEDMTALDNVVINAGYYTTTRRESTGNISRVTAEEIEMQPVVNPLQALQGRMAGVEVEQPSGVTGLATSIRIRGRNSLRFEGDYPLFIIDGVPINSIPINSIGPFSSNAGISPLNTLNLSNIKSIEVLKDADATAIYGSRGANGVVLITSKNGDFGKEHSTFEASIYSGFSKVSNRMKLMNTSQYLAVRKEAFNNDGVTPNEFNAPDLTLWDQDSFTDWQKTLMGETASINNINVSYSGGGKNTSFLLGGSYQNKGDVFPGKFGYNKFTSNFSLHHNSQDKKLTLNLSANYGVDNNELFYGTNFVQLALTLPPNAPKLYNEDGSLNWANGSWANPLAGLYRPQDIRTHNLLANLKINYKLLRRLELKVNIGYSHLNSDETIRNLKRAYNPSTWDGLTLYSYHSSTERKSWIVEPQIWYSGNFDKLNFSALAGSSFQQTQNSGLFIQGSGYSDDSVVGNLNAADVVKVTADQDIDYKYAALFGRLGVNWARKYYLNLTGRRDGSSRFGPNKRFSQFWALGSAWIFSEETFVEKNLPFLSFGKLRGSYGTTGNDQIPDYGYMDTYEATQGPGGLYPTKLFNPNFSWEINKKLEAALQLSFIDDRINFEISWYRNRSSNQLTGYPLPATTGFSSVLANLPATIENTGWEIGLNTSNFIKKDFSWNTFVNVTVPKNELVKFNDLDLSPYSETYRIGQPLDIALLYQYDGIDPETGQYRIADVNEDGRYNFTDRVVERNLGRRYYAGIQNVIKIKNFNLSFLLQYVKQSRKTYFAEMAISPGRYGNNSTEIVNAWRQEGDNTDIQMLSQGIPSLLAYFKAMSSDLSVTDASFLRLKTLSISYQFPSHFLKTFGIKNCILFLHAQNLITKTSYLGLDPQGGKVVPPLRTITTGLKIKI